MTVSLLLTALFMGLAGSLHCLAMCGPASAALVHGAGGGRSAAAAFLLARLLGYAAVGALAAASVGMLERLAAWSPALRPLWVIAHMAALLLGLWLAITARQPAWMANLGVGRDRRHAVDGTAPVAWNGKAAPLPRRRWPLALGLAWFAWPCGLLQSALIVAALANTPAAGAGVMAVFALASAPALGFAPALWARVQSASGPGAAQRWMPLLTRVSGVMLAAASAWALGRDLWVRVIDYCVN